MRGSSTDLQVQLNQAKAELAASMEENQEWKKLNSEIFHFALNKTVQK